MLKLLRKYSKPLLAVFMALLLIVWLGADALQAWVMPNTAKILVANSAFGPIHVRDTTEADANGQILDALRFNWRQPMFAPTRLEQIDWVLLQREAERSGLALSPVFARIAMERQGLMFEIEQLSIRLNTTPRRILEAVAQYFTVLQMTEHVVATVSEPGEAELQAVARDALETIEMGAVRLPASAFVNDDESFTDAELQAHFETYRNRKASGGVEFGYVVPPRVKVEYIKIDRDKVAQNLRVAESRLEKEARRIYEERKSTDPRFMIPVEQIMEQLDDPNRETGPVILFWEEGAREVALDITRKEMANDIADRIGESLIRSAGEAWHVAEVGSDGFRPTPEHVRNEGYYQELIQRLPRSTAYEEATTVRVTDFVTAADISALPGIGGASTARTQNTFPQTLAMLAPKVQGLVTVPPEGAGRDEYLALFQTSSLKLKDGSGNVYVFRVIDTRPEAPAETIDQVRDQVTRDLRLLRGYVRAQSHAERILTAAQTSGLKPAFEADSELAALVAAGAAQLNYYEPAPFSRVNPRMAGLGRRMDTTVVPGMGVVPAATVESCFTLAGRQPPLGVFEVPAAAFVLVAEVRKINPPAKAEYETYRPELMRQMMSNRMYETAGDFLNPENIRARAALQLPGARQ